MEEEPSWQRLISRAIKEGLKLPMRTGTTTRCLFQAKLSARKPCKVPSWIKITCAEEVTKEHTDWPQEKRSNVLWTDESKIVLFGSTITTITCLYHTSLVQGPHKELLQSRQLSLTATHTHITLNYCYNYPYYYNLLPIITPMQDLLSPISLNSMFLSKTTPKH